MVEKEETKKEEQKPEKPAEPEPKASPAHSLLGRLVRVFNAQTCTLYHRALIWYAGFQRTGPSLASP